jgi:hypothetical protein
MAGCVLRPCGVESISSSSPNRTRMFNDAAMVNAWPAKATLQIRITEREFSGASMGVPKGFLLPQRRGRAALRAASTERMAKELETAARSPTERRAAQMSTTRRRTKESGTRQ